LTLRPFHLALSVRDIESTREFYGGILGCEEGRSAETWVDFDLFGHQLSLHALATSGVTGRNAVDGDAVPIPHFGVVLEWTQWHTFAERLVERQVDFVIPPRIRFEGLPGEQATLFFLDPSGNALEFKSFRDDTSIFRQ